VKREKGEGRREKAKKGFLPFAVSLVPFLVLATANSAGYRYGASDLAFYGPAVMLHLDPSLFPTGRAIIDAQAGLTLMDETVGTLARFTTTDFPLLFLALYLASLALLAAGAAAIGQTLYVHRASTIALLMALTLRHAIPRSGTNTLEGYFHPRQLAFAFGVIAIAAFLRDRRVASGAALAGAALLHPTTTLWFAIWLGTASLFCYRKARWRARFLFVPLAGACLVVWALLSGPLAGRLITMDAEWLSLIGEKEYLFPLRWPLSAWVMNLGYVAIIVFLYNRRARAGLLHIRETALVAGAVALVVVFAICVLLSALPLALAVQLQPARVFWMLDLLTMIYVVWALADGNPRRTRRPVVCAVVFTSLALVRGLYVMRVEFPNRPLFEVRVPGDWGRVMDFARSTPRETQWLADPSHAARYGTSLRMAGRRDVFVEGIKDTAIAMYDRTIALRTRRRLDEVRDFPNISPQRAAELAEAYGLNYLIVERDLSLPRVFASGDLRVYRLR